MAKRGNRTGSLYKRTPGGAWIASFWTANGKRREKSTETTDRAAALRILNHYVEAEGWKRHGLVDPKADDFKSADARALTDQATDWQAALLAKGGTKTHADLSHQRVTSIINGCKFQRVSEISAAKVQTYLLERRDNELSIASSNHYLRAVKAFCRWLVREGRARHDPLAHLSLMNERVGRKYVRRALSADELRRLIRTAESGEPWKGIDGKSRAILYRTAADTGLRASELRSLIVGSFRLEGATSAVTVGAAYSKRRREDELPIRPELASALAKHFEGRPVDSPAFCIPRPQRVGAMFHFDREAAGISHKDESDRFVDFHALRHTFISNLV